ncbi:ATP-dependent helicase, partial [Paenibacillus sp. CFBP13512]|uniref:3'-5' exonuclease n=1 Tax=Paenibacillus sp. CFBP13512 TaxID=2184007 RepID=UPI00113D9150
DINSYQLLVNQYNFFFNGIHSRLNQNGFNGEKQKLYVYKNVFKELKGVVVNSCQGIKGEEFETVIAFGLLNGFIPHSSVESKEKSISSKKLMYVIGSRAKTNLYLIAEEGRNKKINDELEKIIFEYDDL